MKFPKSSSPQVFTLIDIKATIEEWTKEEMILKVGEWYTSKVITASDFEDHCEFRKRGFG